jgi:hypothetical protein
LKIIYGFLKFSLSELDGGGFPVTCQACLPVALTLPVADTPFTAFPAGERNNPTDNLPARLQENQGILQHP